MARAVVYAGACAAFGLIYLLGGIIYNLYFHPLRKYPGPFLNRATRLRFCYSVATGTIPFDAHKLHQQYGPVVRIAPDQLAYADPQAWKDIMGHRSHNQPEMSKFDKFYHSVPGGPTHLVNANRDEHSVMRKVFAHSFSEKQIREQEPIIKKYVDLFIQRIEEKSENGRVPLDMVGWFNFLFFDVIGDLAFGEPFGSLDDGEYHPYITSFFKGGRLAVRLYAARFYPLVQKVMLKRMMRDQQFIQQQTQFFVTAIKKLQRRMAAEAPRPDLIQSLLDNKEKLGIEITHVEANSTLLIAAGSETTATLLSGALFCLLTNTDSLKKLEDEVRRTFENESHITFANCNDMPYLKACVDEALRLYPPTPSALPRVVPKGGATIAGSYVPEDTVVEIYQYAMNRAPHLWNLPDEWHPERHLEDPRFATDQLEALQPFHVGPRSCLGRHLANMEMRSILARLVWKFDMTLAESSRTWLDGRGVFDLWDKPPLNVHMKPVVRE